MQLPTAAHLGQRNVNIFSHFTQLPFILGIVPRDALSAELRRVRTSLRNQEAQERRLPVGVPLPAVAREDDSHQERRLEDQDNGAEAEVAPADVDAGVALDGLAQLPANVCIIVHGHAHPHRQRRGQARGEVVDRRHAHIAAGPEIPNPGVCRQHQRTYSSDVVIVEPVSQHSFEADGRGRLDGVDAMPRVPNAGVWLHRGVRANGLELYLGRLGKRIFIGMGLGLVVAGAAVDPSAVDNGPIECYLVGVRPGAVHVLAGNFRLLVLAIRHAGLHGLDARPQRALKGKRNRVAVLLARASLVIHSRQRPELNYAAPGPWADGEGRGVVTQRDGL